MLNKVTLIGMVGKDPETRKFTDTMVCNFSLATSEKFKDKEGKIQEATEWHNLQIWGKLAEIAEKYVKKGSRIYVEGKIKTRAYETESGQKKYVTEIIVNDLKMLDRKPDNGEAKSDVPKSNAPEDDDLPF